MVTQKYYEPLRTSANVAERFGRDSADGFSYVGYLSPSGRVSIGIQPRANVADADEAYEEKLGVPTGHLCYEVDLDTEQVLRISPDYIDAAPLGLSSVPNHRESGKKTKYGLKGITANGRKRVREGAYLLERKYGRRLGFYTLTCPYTDVSQIYEFNRNVAEIARRYFEKLKLYYEDIGETWSYVSVYEYQAKRYETDGYPVLHIHYIAPCYRRGTWTWCCEAEVLRGIYAGVCRDVIGGNPNTSASIDAAVVRKSATGYISKYMSKGGETYAYLAEACPSQIPGQWWSMSQNVKRAIAIATVVLPTEICEYLFSGGGDSPDEILHITRRRYIEVFAGADFRTGEERHIRVGMSAQLCRQGMSAMQTWNIADIPI